MLNDNKIMMLECRGINCFMVFNAIFNNISVSSWRSVLMVEETGMPGENHRPGASHVGEWGRISGKTMNNESMSPLRRQYIRTG